MNRSPRVPSNEGTGADPPSPRRARAARTSDLETKAARPIEAARVQELLEANTAPDVLLRGAQLALRDSEAQFRELIELSSDGIFITDVAGNYLLANPRLCEILGYSEAQLLAMNVAVSYPEMDAAEFAQRLLLIQQEKRMEFVRQVQRKDGLCFTAEIRLQLLRNGTCQGIMRDVSARNREERLLALEHSVVRTLAAADEPSAALVTVMRAVCEAEGWEHGRYWQANEVSGRIVGADSWCAPNSAIEKYLAGSSSVSHARGAGFPGRVWESGEPLWVRDIFSDPWIARRDPVREAGLRSCCVFPIKAEGKTLGVFVLMSLQTREPDTRMIATMAVIGSQVGQFLRRRNAEIALLVSEQFARSTLDSLPAHLCVLDQGGTVLTVNRAWREFAAVDGASSLRVEAGVNYAQACDRQGGAQSTHWARLAEGVRSVLSGREDVIILEYPLHSPTEERWFIVRVSRFSGSGAARALVTHQDITARIHSEAARRASEAHFFAAFEQAPIGIGLIGLDRRWVKVNQALCQLLGYEEQELSGKIVQDFTHPDDHARDLENGASLLAGKIRHYRTEKRYFHKQGHVIWVQLAVSLIRDTQDKPAHFIAHMQDISDQKHAEQAVREHVMQQNLIADFGQKALTNTDLDKLLDELASVAVAGLNVEFCKVLQYGPDGHSLLHKAGIGWQEGWVGGCDPATEDTVRTRFVLTNGEPVSVADFATETRFAPSNVLTVHNICSGVDVPIFGAAGTLGIIGAYSRQRRHFTTENVNFLQSLANTVGAAIDRKASEQRFAYLAQFDSLTGLPNRSLLLDRLAQTLTQAERNNWRVGILFVDLDRFKVVNDTLGHSVGDALLVQVARRLEECVRPGDTVGRLGGDEFAAVLCSLNKGDDAALVADKVVEAMSQSFQLGGQEVYISASLGIGVYPTDGVHADVLLKNADTAMYRAKERGRNTFQFYLPQMNERAAERLALETQLRGALERQEFLLHYQPKANIATGEISGFEALLRWQHPVRGLVGPLEFISILEDTGMIVAVGEWVLRSVAEQLARWKAAGIVPRPVAVNLSARQFQQQNLDSVIAAILAETNVESGLLELELTESMLMKDPEEAVRILKALRAYGVRLAVDDFGTGYSSLSYLQRFPLDALKIDRTFIRDITTKPDDASIAVAIITLAHSLKLKVVAEGVETEAQLDFLRSRGCDEMQGYYFSYPLNIADCSLALREDRRLPHANGTVPLSFNI